MAIKHYQDDRPAYTANTFPILYVLVLLFLGYSVFLVVRSVTSGVDQSQALVRQQNQIDQLKLKVAVTERFIVYQQTPNYIEKQAREHFNYIKPGESVVSVVENNDQSQAVVNEQAGLTAAASEHVTSPHLEQWWSYFFGKQ